MRECKIKGKQPSKESTDSLNKSSVIKQGAQSGPAGSDAEESVPKGFPLSGQARRDPESSVKLGKESRKWFSLPSK